MIEWKSFEEGKADICTLIEEARKRVKPVITLIMGDPNSGKTYLAKEIEKNFPELRIFHEEKDYQFITNSDYFLSGLSNKGSNEDLIIFTNPFCEISYSPSEMLKFGASGNFSGWIKDAFGREPDIRAYISRTGELNSEDKKTIESGHYNVVIRNSQARIKGR